MKKNQKEIKPLFGSAAPQAIDAERAVIGALINFGQAVDQVSFLTPGMFYDPRHETLFEAVLSLRKKNAPVDMITVTQEIAAMGKSEEVTVGDIASVCFDVITDVYITNHALYVLDKYIQREIINVCMELQRDAGDDTNDVADVLFRAGKEFERIQEELVGQQQASSYQEISGLFYEDIQVRMNKFNTGQQTGVTTGLTELNRITSGWQGSELVILAARPAMGKTALALHFAQSAAGTGIPIVIFSLEMPKVSLYNRSVLSLCNNLDAANLKSGNLLNDLDSIDKSVAHLSKLPIYVDDNPNINMAYIRSVSRLLHKKKRCGMVIIDYLQLITAEKNKYSNREQEIASMSRQAKLLAKEMDIPVILLSQLNRDVEKRHDKRPQLSDLRESGAIEQDADMVLFIHRPGCYGQEVTDQHGNRVENAGELIIAKYRNGAIGRVRFKHNDTLTRIYDYRLPAEKEQLNINF